MRPARKHRTAPLVVGVVVGALALVGLAVPPWVLPPIQSKETGPAAIEMVQFTDAERVPEYNTRPAPLPAADNANSQRAGDVYQNVEILGDLSEAEFTRLMLAMTEWVSPEAGCGYCHNLEEGYANEDLYTKTVARQMLRMTRAVNTEWGSHVAPSGVTCYTCHRGENVPPWKWFEQKEPSNDQFLGKPRPWYLQARSIRNFFPNVPFEKYLLEDHATANIQSLDPLVNFEKGNGDNQQTVVAEASGDVDRDEMIENLYLFMMQMSNSLGVNCTYCHNSRAFFDWEQSTPYRWIGYWGIRMTRVINSQYIQPIGDAFPPSRKGPLGDPFKVNCGTCHLGENKPMAGYNLTQHYLAGLTENGQAITIPQAEAQVREAARPIAVNNSVPNPPAPTALPVSRDAIAESVAPSGAPSGASGDQQTGSGNAGQSGNGEQSGGGIVYRSQTQPGQAVDDPTLGGTVTPVDPAQGPAAKPPEGDSREGSNPRRRGS